MKQQCLPLLLISLGAAAQPAAELPPRGYSTPAQLYQVLDTVPDEVSVAQDRVAIQVFIDDKRAAGRAFVDRMIEQCPRLLDGTVTAREFAQIIDDEDDSMERDLIDAYQRMLAKLTVQGNADLEAKSQRIRGTTLRTSAVAAYDTYPFQWERQLRRRCANGFPTEPVPGSFMEKEGE